MAAPKTATRPYAIRTKPAGEIVAIVRAGSPAAALRHHFRSRFAEALPRADVSRMYQAMQRLRAAEAVA